MKIILTGAQGTGKTTVLSNVEYPKITEVVRKLAKHGININEMGDEEGQIKIFNKYKSLFKVTPEFISDRGLTDVFAYTTWLYKHGRVSEEFWKKQKAALRKFQKDNPDIVYCYFPIEFPLVKDGVRSEDESFRKEIDEIIQDILQAFGFDYIEVTGPIEDRVNIIYTLL